MACIGHSGSDRANRSAARHEPKIAFVRPKAGGKRDGKKDGLQMKEYEFEVDVVAVVRVKAPDEEAARKVVPTVLGAPSSVEIRQANEKHASLGVKATVTEVEFTPDRMSRSIKRLMAKRNSNDVHTHHTTKSRGDF